MAQAQPDRKLMKRLLHQVGRAIQEFGLVQDGDRILVGISGGKDSFTLLYLLQRLRERAPIRFDLVACNLDRAIRVSLGGSSRSICARRHAKCACSARTPTLWSSGARRSAAPPARSAPACAATSAA